MSNSIAERCPYEHLEQGFVWGLQRSLLRHLQRSGMGPRMALAILTRQLEGQLKTHLERNPRKCFDRMVGALEDRMRIDEQPGKACHSPNDILEAAATPGSWWNNSHLEGCRYCREEVSWVRERLPDFSEFNIR